MKKDSIKIPLRRFPNGRLLVCEPKYFDVEYEINPWMHKDIQPDPVKTARQWQLLHHTLIRLGAWIEYVEPQPKVPDLVYTANAGLVRGKKVVISSFRHPERQAEEPFFEKWFQDAGFETSKVQGAFFEGAGDALFAGESLLVAGYGIRTEQKAYEQVQKLLDIPELVFVELIDPRYYHLDLTICPLNDKQAIFNPRAMTPDSVKRLESKLELFDIGEEDAAKFACNAVVIGKGVVLPAGAKNTEAILKKVGYRPQPVELSELMKGGGASKCLTLRIG